MRKRTSVVADKAVQPAENKQPARVYIRMRPGRSVRVNGVLVAPGQYIWAEKAIADNLIASGYADYLREA